MKRTELRRKTPLRQRAPLKRRTRLKAAGDGLKRAALRRRPPEPISAAERRAMARFREAITGEVCVMCGRTAAEARTATGYGHHAHHAVRRQTLRKLGLDEWDPRVAACACEEPCHRQHTSRKRRIALGQLPARVHAFAALHGLQDALEREHPRGT